MDDNCTVLSCEFPVYREGYCATHYHAWQRYLANLPDRTEEAERLMVARPTPPPPPPEPPPVPKPVVARKPPKPRPPQTQSTTPPPVPTPAPAPAFLQLWKVEGELRIGEGEGRWLATINTKVVAHDRDEALAKAKTLATPLERAWWNGEKAEAVA